MALFTTKNIHKRRKKFEDHGVLDYAISTEDGKIMESFKRVSLYKHYEYYNKADKHILIKDEIFFMPYKAELDYSLSPEEIFSSLFKVLQDKLIEAARIQKMHGNNEIPVESARYLVEILEKPGVPEETLRKLGYRLTSEGYAVPIDESPMEKPAPVPVPRKEQPKDYFTKPSSSDGMLSSAFLTKMKNMDNKGNDISNR